MGKYSSNFDEYINIYSKESTPSSGSECETDLMPTPIATSAFGLLYTADMPIDFLEEG